MSDPHTTPMQKEVCCKNWIKLLDYIENSPDLQGGLSGRDALEMVLAGLGDDPDFLIQAPDNLEPAYLKSSSTSPSTLPNLPLEQGWALGLSGDWCSCMVGG